MYSITSVMPSLAFPDGNLKQSNKSNLRTLQYRIIGGFGIIGGQKLVIAGLGTIGGGGGGGKI